MEPLKSPDARANYGKLRACAHVLVTKTRLSPKNTNNASERTAGTIFLAERFAASARVFGWIFPFYLPFVSHGNGTAPRSHLRSEQHAVMTVP